MSRNLFAFLLSELQVVRIQCPKCAAVTELTVEQLGYRLDNHQCPVCRHDWPGLRHDNGESRLSRLAKAITALQDNGDAPRVEFIMPDDSAKK